jgi:hypothetical protein
MQWLPLLFAGRLEQEPTPPLGFINPIFQQARGSHVAVFIAEIVSFAHPRRQLFVIIAKLSEHVHRGHVIGKSGFFVAMSALRSKAAPHSK